MDEPEYSVPRHCRCWMLWDGDARAEGAICTDFEPNHFTMLAGHAMCMNCKHLEVCHPKLAVAS